MNPLWFLDGTFWEKMYFVTMVVGVTIFMNFLFDIIPEIKKEFREIRKKAKVEYRKQIIESKKVSRRWKEMIKNKTKISCICVAVCLICVAGLQIIPESIQGENQSSSIMNEVEPSASHYVYYAGLFWDDRTIGSLCDKTPGFGYANVPAQGTITVNTTSFDDSVVMKFDKTVGTASMDAYFERELSGGWQTQFDLSVDDTATNVGLWLYEDTTMVLGTGFESGKLFVWDGAVVTYTDIVVETWYHFDIRFDTSSDTYSVRVDDISIESGSLAAVVDEINEWRYKVPTTATGVIYSDNFALYSWQNYEYETDDLPYELIDALNYVIENYYNPGSTALYGTSAIISDYEDEETRGYPRMIVAHTLDAAIVAYEITLNKTYYDLAEDLSRWLVEVAQHSSGYFIHYGGIGYNLPNNVLTTSECSYSLLRMYQLTREYQWYNSAVSGLGFIITNCFNESSDLFYDYPPTVELGEHTRINFNANVAKTLAFAYYLLGDVVYRNYSEGILDSIITYQYFGKPTESPMENYTACGWYGYNTENETWQGFDYEGYTAKGFGGAMYYLQLAEYEPTSYSDWQDAFEASMFTIYEYFGWDMIVNISLHNYLETYQAFCFYDLIMDNPVILYEDMFISMAEYLTDRADYTLSSNDFLPHNCAYDLEDYLLSSYTSLGQLGHIWEWKQVNSFYQPYQLSLNSTTRIMLSTVGGTVELHDISQDNRGVYWTTVTGEPTLTVTYSFARFDYVPGLTSTSYKVYKDDVFLFDIGGQNDGIMYFESDGNGTFRISKISNPYPEPFAQLMIFLILIGICAAIVMYILKIKDTGRILGG